MKFSTVGEDLVKQRRTQVFVTIHLGARGNEHVFGKTNPTQAAVSASHPLDAAFVATRHDDHQIHIAVFARRAPGVRAEHPDLFGLKFRHEPLRGCLKQIVVKGFHDANITKFRPRCKSGHP